MSTKTMKGIDISSYQSGINLSKVKCDFVIVKISEGLSAMNNDRERQLKQAMDLGKCIGFYHFARPETNDAIKEAQVFYKLAKDYFGKGIPVLDWESKGKANIAWAKKWLDEIHRLTGVKPMIYMSTSVANSYDWSSVVKEGYALWVAQYRDYVTDEDYDMRNAGPKPKVKYWNSYVMWQWTSKGRLKGYAGDLDCDIFYGDKAAWNKYAGIKTPTKPPVKPEPKPAKLVVDGLFYTASVKRLQQWLNISQTGKITGQKTKMKKYIPAIEKVCTWTGKGSTAIRALQELLKAKGYDPGTIDGLCGKNTVTALQTYLKAKGYNPGSIDGIFGENTAKALQRFLNTR